MPYLLWSEALRMTVEKETEPHPTRQPPGIAPQVKMQEDFWTNFLPNLVLQMPLSARTCNLDLLSARVLLLPGWTPDEKVVNYAASVNSIGHPFDLCKL